MDSDLNEPTDIRCPARSSRLRLARQLSSGLAKRIGLLLVVLFSVYFAVALLPGNGVRSLLGRDASPAEVAAKERELGLDQSVLVRFGRWLGNLVTGDLGTTFRGVSVNSLLAEKIPNTLVLAAAAFAVTTVVSVALAARWALHPRGPLGRTVPSTTMVSIALPEFVVATVLILVFALALDVLPAVTVQDAAGSPASVSMYVLPCLALAIPQIGWNTRVFHASIVDALSLPFVRTAIVDGLTPAAVLARYVLPRALPTIVASLATTVGMIVGGAVVVETLFNFPGIGSVISGSVGGRDANVVVAVVAITGATIVAFLLFADLVREWATRRSV